MQWPLVCGCVMHDTVLGSKYVQTFNVTGRVDTADQRSWIGAGAGIRDWAASDNVFVAHRPRADQTRDGGDAALGAVLPTAPAGYAERI